MALERLHVGGLITNRDYLVAILASPEFVAGDTTTDFIDRVRPTPVVEPAVAQQAAVAGAMWLQGRNRAADGLWGFAPSNWRNAGLPSEQVSFINPSNSVGDGADTEPLMIAYKADRDGRFNLDSGETVEIVGWSLDRIALQVDGIRRSHRITSTSGRLHIQTAATTVTLEVIPRFSIPGAEVPTGGLTAPMPGAVVEIRCGVGETVSAGQVLIVLEAMKMEHHVVAPFDGIVTEVPISVGQQLGRGTVLLTVVEGDDEGNRS